MQRMNKISKLQQQKILTTKKTSNYEFEKNSQKKSN